jgi:hypothetical protein
VARRSEAIIVAGAAASAARVLRKDFSAQVFARFASTALRRGVRSQSRGWLYAGAAAYGISTLHKYAGRKEEVFSIKLRRGEALEIREVRRAK